MYTYFGEMCNKEGPEHHLTLKTEQQFDVQQWLIVSWDPWQSKVVRVGTDEEVLI